MKIGFFTDTYFPQISGVATSIQTLKNELEKRGHEVYIFTTTDPNATDSEYGIIRMPSIPFVSFKDRRVVVRGMLYAYSVAKELNLDIIHTHTEFGTGILGKIIAKKLQIPCVHTYHTMYEDYLHYILKGKVIRPGHVKQLSRLFCNHLSGIVCPSTRVVSTLSKYNISVPKEVIPTGVNLAKFKQSRKENEIDVRKKYGIASDKILMLSLSRLSFEKNIQAILSGMKEIHEEESQVHLLVVGDGPYRESLEEFCEKQGITTYVTFSGEVSNDFVGEFYRQADYFVSCSSSESQGLTYIEAMASGVKCVVKGNEYLNQLITDSSLGVTFDQDEQFSDTFLSYLKQGHLFQDNTQKRQQALSAISSDTFGEKMVLFYQKSQSYYQEKVKEQSEVSSSIKLFKRW